MGNVLCILLHDLQRRVHIFLDPYVQPDLFLALRQHDDYHVPARMDYSKGLRILQLLAVLGPAAGHSHLIPPVGGRDGLRSIPFLRLGGQLPRQQNGVAAAQQRQRHQESHRQRRGPYVHSTHQSNLLKSGSAKTAGSSPRIPPG